ncbi:type VI secretion system contractile sheath large subunit [Myxococcaceae bacterium GXIMD 01537]
MPDPTNTTTTTTTTSTTTPPAAGGAAATTTLDPKLKQYLGSVRLETELPQLRPMVTVKPADPAANKLATVEILDDKDVSNEERFLASMATVAHNMDLEAGRFDKQSIQDLVATIDKLVDAQLNAVLHTPKFQALESTWTSVADLVQNTNFRANIQLSLLDVPKDEAFADLQMNSADIGGSEFFKKLYVAEYDQYGGTPFGGIVGIYEFDNTPDDLLWLKTMGKIATASHAPFISAISPKFLGCNSMREVSQLRDVYGLLDTPRFSGWNKLRDTEEAAYIGLTMPRFIVREPYNNTTNPASGVNFTEKIRGDDDSEYLWGNSAMLFARNLVKSFETSGWCQHIRGPKGGGRITGLPVHVFNVRGEEEMKLPVEISIPDFREFELARSGLIPLIHKKGTADAVFFSAQSIKKAHTFKDPKDSENSQLVTNLAYTFSISRIAHYLKCIMRDNIGSTANAQYIFTQIDRWISGYVTALVNPDDLTLRYYPFKAYSLEVTDMPGKVGWYKCSLSILPHIQFEGMDVDLRVDARLG